MQDHDPNNLNDNNPSPNSPNSPDCPESPESPESLTRAVDVKEAGVGQDNRSSESVPESEGLDLIPHTQCPRCVRTIALPLRTRQVKIRCKQCKFKFLALFDDAWSNAKSESNEPNSDASDAARAEEKENEEMDELQKAVQRLSASESSVGTQGADAKTLPPQSTVWATFACV